MTGDPARPDGLIVTNRYGLPIRPPRPAETAAPPGDDPPVPAGTYHPPTGESVRWRDLELPPDADLPAIRATSPPALTLVPPDESDDPDDGLVYDSYRRRS